MKKIILLLIISKYCLASDFLVLFDMPDNKKYIKFKSIPFRIEPKKEIPPLSNLVPIPKGDNQSRWIVDGVVKADNKLLAIINGNIYKVGDRIEDSLIIDINMNYVEIEKNGKKDKILIK